jgi:hypothetical protein
VPMGLRVLKLVRLAQQRVLGLGLPIGLRGSARESATTLCRPRLGWSPIARTSLRRATDWLRIRFANSRRH